MTFLTYWKSFQILGKELFIMRHGLLYLWNKLYLGVKCRFVLWVVLCFYVELQLLCALSDTGKYRAPPSDEAHELSKASLWHLKYFYAVPLRERRKCMKQWLTIFEEISWIKCTDEEQSLNMFNLCKRGILKKLSFYFGSVHLKFMDR